jgi:hypothetical protein
VFGGVMQRQFGDALSAVGDDALQQMGQCCARRSMVSTSNRSVA